MAEELTLAEAVVKLKLDLGELKAGRPRTEVQLLNFTPWRDLP